MNENLIPMSKRAPEERRELGAKGGRKCGENTRKRKTLRALAEAYGGSQIKSPRLIATMKSLGVDPKDCVQDMLLIMKCFQGISEGNPKWAEVYLKIRGEESPNLMAIKRDEVALRKREYELKKKIAEAQLSQNEKKDDKQQVLVIMPPKDSD